MILLNKIILLGIDGGTFDLLKPWIKKGELSTFKKVLYGGTYGNLKTTIPCLSVPAIPSLCTGMNPGKLGVFGFLRADGSLGNYNDIEEDCIWDILADNGVKSCIVNLTGTYPPRIKNGIMISGGAPSEQSDYVYPKEFKSKIKGFYSEFDLFMHACKKLNPQKNMSKIVELAKLALKRRWGVFRHLMRNDNFGLGIFWIVLSDDIQHYYWGFEDIILTFYKEIDRILKDLIETFEDFNIVIVSDHGFENKAKYYFNINSWLRYKGYLKMKGSELRKSFFYRMSAFLEHLWRSSPNEIKYFLLKLMPSRVSSTDTEESINRRDFLLGVDWENTIAYADASCLGIKVNLRNYELYEHVRLKIIEELKGLKNGRGDSIIRGVWKREQVFSGKYSEETPDIILLADKNYQINPFISEKMITNIKSWKNRHIRGDHMNARDGIFIFYGPIFKRGYKVKGLSILDIAPTILHIMGGKIPQKMDGKVVKEIFKKESELEKKEIKTQKRKKEAEKIKEIDPEEMEQIKERLNALGYLE